MRGILVLGYLDKEMNERSFGKSPVKVTQKTKDDAAIKPTKHFE